MESKNNPVAAVAAGIGAPGEVRPAGVFSLLLKLPGAERTSVSAPTGVNAFAASSGARIQLSNVVRKLESARGRHPEVGLWTAH